MDTGQHPAPFNEQVSVTVNGRAVQLDSSALVALLKDFSVDADSTGVAVAVDGTVVPKSQWQNTVLLNDQRIEVLGAMQGG